MAVLLCSWLPAGAAFNSLLKEIPKLTGQSEILLLLSLDDGSVIFSQNENKQSAPASLTKLVTAILTLENCADTKTVLTLRQEIFETYNAFDSSNAGLLAGEELSVEELLYCLLLPSANEAAQVLADSVGGGEAPGSAKENIARFVAMMNDFAARLGCTNTHFENAHGLDAAGHLTTAADIAKILRYALSADFPGNALFETIVATREHKLPATNKHGARNIYSTNLMLNAARKEYYLQGIAGIKTGHTSQAGECITAMASRDGFKYLCIVMRGQQAALESGGAKFNTAFIDCKALLDWSFAHIRYQRVVPADTVVGELPVALARATDHVQLVPQTPLSALVPEGVDSGSVYIEMIQEDPPRELTAPIKKGEVLAQARVLYAGQEFARIDLVASETINRSASMYLVELAKQAIGNRITHLLLIAVIFVAVLYLVAIYLKGRSKRQEKQMRVLPDIQPGGKKK
ncbi:MAG: D-alanyl-D-alanine carboxypeptidase [Oscillospiraceae bacterium]|nr:D-alanyl-D-alanine carboxypeptidase [Oscillospiraceae bacterium]